jgi:hypothetical protein
MILNSRSRENSFWDFPYNGAKCAVAMRVARSIARLSPVAWAEHDSGYLESNRAAASKASARLDASMSGQGPTTF